MVAAWHPESGSDSGSKNSKLFSNGHKSPRGLS